MNHELRITNHVKIKKIILGIATLWSILYFFIFFLFFIDQFLRLIGMPFESVFQVIFVAHISTMAWTAVLLFIYIKNVFKNPNVPSDKRTLWAVVLFFGHMVSMPIYWYLYIWRERHEQLKTQSKII